MGEEGWNRREGQRLTRRELMSVELRPSGADASAPAVVVSTETTDVSACGLRILLPAPVAPDGLFDFCIEVKDHPQRFLLTGEVRWCHRLPEQEKYEAGVLIHDGQGTVYPQWAELF